MEGCLRSSLDLEPSQIPAQVLDAAWIPQVYDARADSLTFVHLPRDVQRRMVFLDQRFVGDAPDSAPIPIKELPAKLIRERAGPVHFIFHTGFCCSTLLTRALDIPGTSMGLKEPPVLTYLAHLWSTSGMRTPGAPEALSLILDLLSRPLTPGETQIVKPNNLCNHLIPEVMHARPEARVLLLHTGLDASLRAIARRGPGGRAFARNVFHAFSRAIPLDMYFTTEDLLQFTDLQIAALAWLMQARFFDSIAARYGRERVRILSVDTFLANPVDALARLTAFFELPLDAAQVEALATGPVFREHAKNLGRPFDAGAYRAQQAESQARHGEELDAVRPWAAALAPRAGAPLSLRNTLMD